MSGQRPAIILLLHAVIGMAMGLLLRHSGLNDSLRIIEVAQDFLLVLDVEIELS